MDRRGGIEHVAVHAFEIPTDGPGGTEQDGTMEWTSTTMVLVEVHARGEIGIGYTYGDVSTARFIESMLVPVILGADPMTPPILHSRMSAAVRNAGRTGVGAMALSAADVAVWDLKAKQLGLPLARVLPAYHDDVPIYGSGGFTNYSLTRLVDQLAGWFGQGIPRVKMKISRHPTEDPERLATVRRELGDAPEIFVDSNGALSRKAATYWAGRLAEDWDVRWFEEPVSSDDLAGLRLVREHAPGLLEVAAGEYAFIPRDFTDLLHAAAVDCLQADVTRCGGITSLLEVAGLAAAEHVDLSAHCAPAISVHAFSAVRRLRHLEYFHDHVRVENVVFDGIPTPVDGTLRPTADRPGLGLQVRWADAERYRTHGSETHASAHSGSDRSST
ncbi:MAG TPA: enolase C-terminal domain-like protein [Actinopolymorphaceae bacterium]|jgi:L-alanine-DL-glutamate epimerase-like enolase superfamily enzyme